MDSSSVGRFISWYQVSAKKNETMKRVALLILSILLPVVAEREKKTISPSYFYHPSSSEISDKKDYHKFSQAYSLWFQPSEKHKFDVLLNEINTLAKEYSGTFHQPHATLYGAIYTENETYVTETAKYLASVISPITLQYNYMDSKKPNLNKRWRAGLTIRYVHNDNFTSAALVAMGSVRAKDCQLPHTTMLYDFNGEAYEDLSAVEKSVNRLEKHLGHNLSSFHWVAQSIAVVYTPLRDHWKSAEDMRTIVGHWKKIASFPLLAAK